MTPASKKELTALLTRAEDILEKNYLGTSHAEILRIIERALVILKIEEIRTDTPRDTAEH